MKSPLFAAAACLALSVSCVSVAHADDGHHGRTLFSLFGGGKSDDAPAAIKDKEEAKFPYQTLISSYAKAYGVPVKLARAVVNTESGFNAKARGRHGEIGLMQIKPATARAMGYKGSVAGLYDPDTNLKYGMKYLAIANRLGGGDTCQALLRYNAGHAATRMNPTSREYCGEVMAKIGEKV
ncbi:lytic transglycosylase domain-containing protein [Allorhizobium sp. BGMRC 0089]|uniref:lytic transglycosylase domain-containing protein n=1 Tax=Allorhizobium sonneratiae TaxID=2934936 RepID=UPI0020341D0D|nr:lytic transglycosylase domain-containing protein [Allorhizobium sonneratiae]MCM2294202.1 lytic transglycosylase domain-containing protein [Allorhizobium sonneratiae]